MNDQKGVRIALRSVEFHYSESRFVFNAEIPAGSITAVLGASGSGKSTLLNLVAGFEKPLRGTIEIDGIAMTDVEPSERPVSMIFQENNLFAHLTVAQNVGLGRSSSLRLSRQDKADLASALAATGLVDKEARKPSALSGGERQRVAIARILLRERPALLLDEPFASLGPQLRQEMLELLRDVHARQRPTVLFVTHHPEDARAICDRVIFIEEGAVLFSGTAKDFFSQNSEAYRRYLGAST
ncbi:ATP-binding cassette domain-containing protein [Limoniibacter endophyticus]|uniref:Thiamine import ATP-binding protein ThiQ n=1 Tax=Limoniibacter endophyticus TaxID=1565040 RepID=A0A8J3DKD9_9HYPH|nr:ATP-binding cassette domain-containing protein [Limoniibacter endophyticus]GHC77222.1 thiamine import ATP-binding protein ThiQ [Limoniibacter endophyticus]